MTRKSNPEINPEFPEEGSLASPWIPMRRDPTPPLCHSTPTKFTSGRACAISRRASPIPKPISSTSGCPRFSKAASRSSSAPYLISSPNAGHRSRNAAFCACPPRTRVRHSTLPRFRRVRGHSTQLSAPFGAACDCTCKAKP
eukprot:1185686-Prorocentrum_minimum.AAC.2